MGDNVIVVSEELTATAAYRTTTLSLPCFTTGVAMLFTLNTSTRVVDTIGDIPFAPVDFDATGVATNGTVDFGGSAEWISFFGGVIFEFIFRECIPGVVVTDNMLEPTAWFAKARVESKDLVLGGGDNDPGDASAAPKLDVDRFKLGPIFFTLSPSVE